MAQPTDAPRIARTVCLIGLRCTGKTTLGRALAELADCEFIDLDDELLAAARESRAFDSAGQVLEQLGQPAFRELESACLARALVQPGPRVIGPRVIATGGGVVELERNRDLLAATTCLWLRATPATLRARLRADPAARPSLTGADPEQELELLLERRAPWYRALAAAELETDAREPAALAHTALELLNAL